MIYIDIVIVILFILGFLEGWKKGLLTSAVNFASSILIFVLAILLKGPISLILIEHFPFISFKGIFAGITSLNIILYEGIAFFIAVVLLTLIFKLILKLTGVLNKVLNATIILGLPNKIGGAIINVLRYYIIAFIIIFIISLIPKTSVLVKESYLSDNILNKTPILSNTTKNINKSLSEIYDLSIKIDENTTVNDIDEQCFEILLKYGIISKETAADLHESGKLELENFDSIVDKY